jgi:hypothetical protein
LPQKGAKSAKGTKRCPDFFVNFVLLCGKSAFLFCLVLLDLGIKKSVGLSYASLNPLKLFGRGLL